MVRNNIHQGIEVYDKQDLYLLLNNKMHLMGFVEYYQCIIGSHKVEHSDNNLGL